MLMFLLVLWALKLTCIITAGIAKLTNSSRDVANGLHYGMENKQYGCAWYAATSRVKPRRSIILAWCTEQKGWSHQRMACHCLHRGIGGHACLALWLLWRRRSRPRHQSWQWNQWGNGRTCVGGYHQCLTRS